MVKRFDRSWTASARPVEIQENTERPITVEMGTNVLAGTTKEGILKAYAEALKKAKQATVPPLWDGKAAARIWEVLKNVKRVPGATRLG
jgi:UDP-N-acetylglucosamine 2-epimerase (non-hydrolysing)